jgi:hypothetical protein
MPKKKIITPRPISGIIVSLIIFILGILCIYRGVLKEADLEKIDSQITSHEVFKDTCFSGKRARVCYKLLFYLTNTDTIYGIYLGYNPAAKDKLISKLQTGKEYSFFIDPTIPEVDGIKLGIRIIKDNQSILFKENGKLSLKGGIIFILMGSGLFLLIYKKYE